MEASTIAVIVAAVFGGGGIIGGVVALLKFRGESTAVLVSASGEVVIMQKGMISQLREDLDAARADHATEVTRCLQAAASLRAELESVRRDVQRSHSRHDTQDVSIRRIITDLDSDYPDPGPTPGQMPENLPDPPDDLPRRQ